MKINPNTDAVNSFIEVLGTTDNAVYATIAAHPIVFGRGKANIVFDAGNCLADIKLQFAY
ncbi:hypothetical protein [Psychrosphaera algicola]|uniref:Uncharacterized protein n=1 Tax=Psychrosphaera algicola TaxID=3023714 RepID=A0ABT5FGY8_9GAMM|nr:hypothetical protein [Psychrosphaera sp. G1-22]MDC2890347.1 hypothetical protein [Psychrosphaera sp. G1-22]